MADSTPTPEQAEQKNAPASPAQVAVPTTAPSGRRLALQDLKVQLTDADLANPGTQKCILDMLIRAEDECNDLEQYRSQFHKADKESEVLKEKLKSNKVNEVMFGVGVGVGCAFIGLAPFFWDVKGAGPLILIVGLALTIGATIGRIVFK